jgi:hypothetical protein
VVTSEDLAGAYRALDDCEEKLRRLDATCCEPGRSPRMKALGETLAAARSRLDAMPDDNEAVDEVVATLEDAGAQIGWLQVGCCAPNRLPLYAGMLEGLMTAQLTVNRAAGRGH